MVSLEAWEVISSLAWSFTLCKEILHLFPRHLDIFTLWDNQCKANDSVQEALSNGRPHSMVVEAEQNRKCTAPCTTVMWYYWLISNLSLSDILGISGKMLVSAERKEEKQVQPRKLVWKVLPSHLSKETGSFMEDLLEVHQPNKSLINTGGCSR